MVMVWFFTTAALAPRRKMEIIWGMTCVWDDCRSNNLYCIQYQYQDKFYLV